MEIENGEAVDWTYLAVNASFERLTGLKNVTGKKISEVVPRARELDRALASHPACNRARCGVRAKRGSFFRRRKKRKKPSSQSWVFFLW